MTTMNQTHMTGIVSPERLYRRHLSFEAIAWCDEWTFTEIVKKYSDTLLSTAMHVTKEKQVAEDIVQEAFLKLWKNRTTLTADNIGGWLYKVVAHSSYKHVKKEARKVEVLSSLRLYKQGIVSDVEERIIHKQDMEFLDEVYARLPRKQKEVYRLSQKEGLSRNEIAYHLNISVYTVKNHLTRACQFMKEHLTSICLGLIFFLFNNLFFNRSSPNPKFRDLYKVDHAINKPLSERTTDHFLNAISFSEVKSR